MQKSKVDKQRENVKVLGTGDRAEDYAHIQIKRDGKTVNASPTAPAPFSRKRK